MNFQQKVFLATTALEDFWDTSASRLVFLGNWCRRFSRREIWSSLNAEVLQSPWTDELERQKAHLYIDNLYNCVLPNLGNAINDIHGVKYSTKFWRIVIGPWLRWYITVMYDRYSVLRSAIEKYRNFNTIGLSKSSFITPYDTYEFVNKVTDDIYNLQIYTQLLHELGFTYSKKEIKTVKKNNYNNSWHKIFTNNFLIKSIAGLHRVSTLLWNHKGLIIHVNSYFSGMRQLSLFFRTYGRILPMQHINDDHVYTIDYNNREKVKNIISNKNEFESLLDNILFSFIPCCFIETFQETNEILNKYYSGKIKMLFSSTGWYFNEPFKQLAGNAAENGATLIATQHG